MADRSLSRLARDEKTVIASVANRRRHSGLDGARRRSRSRAAGKNAQEPQKNWEVSHRGRDGLKPLVRVRGAEGTLVRDRDE
jgi:hypothetical protein